MSMFSKSRINEPIEPPKPGAPVPPEASPVAATAAFASAAAPAAAPATPMPKPKPSPSTISSDLVVTGNIVTTGDLHVEGKIEGDIRAHLLTIGEAASISGEIVADDIVVHGHIRGRVRGLKVRLTSTARVEGDIIHKTIAIESGAHFEGSVQRRDDPLGDSKPAPAPIGARPAPKPAESA